MLAHGEKVVAVELGGSDEYNENWIFSSTHFPKRRREK